jgi:hypothetical protein
MYDTIELRLPKDKAKVNLLESVPCYLSNISEWEKDNFVSITGFLKGLKVKVNENNVKILDSSLCKYYLGNNIETMFRGDVQRAVESISDELHLPFQNANVTRIDLAQNLLMKHKEELYLPYLGNSQYYKRLEQPDGLYYNNSKRQIVFYQKIKEQKAKGNVIPQHLKNASILRYELRLKKRLPGHFKKPEVLASDLFDEVFYMDIQKEWKGEYHKIQKINSIIHNMQPTGSTKEFIEYLALIGLLKVGVTQAFKLIKEWQGRGEIGKKQASDLRKKVKALNENPALTEKNELIKELDEKVNEAVYNFR